MHVQTIPVTDRPVNNLVLDVVPVMTLVLLHRVNSAGQRDAGVLVYAAEMPRLSAALAQAQQTLAAAGVVAEP